MRFSLTRTNAFCTSDSVTVDEPVVGTVVDDKAPTGTIECSVNEAPVVGAVIDGGAVVSVDDEALVDGVLVDIIIVCEGLVVDGALFVDTDVECVDADLDVDDDFLILIVDEISLPAVEEEVVVDAPDDKDAKVVETFVANEVTTTAVDGVFRTVEATIDEAVVNEVETGFLKVC